MNQTVDSLPSRNGGTDLIDYSLKESNRKLILERRKIQLMADKTSDYNASRGDTITWMISPGSQDEWLDGRSSYLTANIRVTGTSNDQLYLPNGPASAFSQVQVISASGQTLVNIIDYATIQQMFTEWTACPSWKAGIGQMYGSGSDELGQWEPARYAAGIAKNGVTNGAYGPFASGIPRTTYNTNTGAEAAYLDAIEQRPAGSALALQTGLQSATGVTFAFRLDLAWIFGCPTLIPSQFFPLTLKATLQNPNQTLAYVGVSSAQGPNGPQSLAPYWNGTTYVANPNLLPGITGTATPAANIDLIFSNVRFMASLCKLSPQFKQKTDEEMANGSFQLTVTNYYASTGNILGGNAATLNTTFSAHDCQAFYCSLIPQINENNLWYDFAYRWGGYDWGKVAQNITSAQLLLNGRYWPPQPNTTYVDMYHDTLASFNTHSENVSFSPVSYSRFTGKSFTLGWLLDRDASSSLTGVDSVSSPVWTLYLQFASTLAAQLNVHTCVAYSQVLEIGKDSQIKIFQ